MSYATHPPKPKSVTFKKARIFPSHSIQGKSMALKFPSSILALNSTKEVGTFTVFTKSLPVPEGQMARGVCGFSE
jgi:hypothetical protein